MHNNLFDRNKQEKMRLFFLDLAQKGKEKNLCRGEIFKHRPNTINILKEGKVKECLSNYKGTDKSLFILLPGEIFGEMNYFSCGKANTVITAMKETTISMISEDTLENILQTNKEAYRYFLHSVTRKYRIVMLQMSDLVFNNSTGKLAHMLYRLSEQQGKITDKGITIDISLTHKDLASLIGCSRSTVSRGLKILREKDILFTNKKKITIRNKEQLKEHFVI